ncbi:MAG: hypothetical protein M1837_004743 [Sclerophora amabilis]|nr:MAG: hypothetical protein M1837_004743 [Sclerophora amabilis]
MSPYDASPKGKKDTVTTTTGLSRRQVISPAVQQSPKWSAWLILPPRDDKYHNLDEDKAKEMGDGAAHYLMKLDFSEESSAAKIYTPETTDARSQDLEREYIQIDWINQRHTPETYKYFPTPNRRVVELRVSGPGPAQVSDERSQYTLGWWISTTLQKGYAGGAVISEDKNLAIMFEVKSSPKPVRVVPTETTWISDPQDDQPGWYDGKVLDLAQDNRRIGQGTAFEVSPEPAPNFKSQQSSEANPDGLHNWVVVMTKVELEPKGVR